MEPQVREAVHSKRCAAGTANGSGAVAGVVMALALVLAPPSARALEEYGAQIPNLVPAGGCDGLCHGSGFLSSPLYQDFAAAGFVWNATMANADSDGDGFSNGWELQNPSGTWVSGTPNPGNSALVTDPVSGASLPLVPVAVTPAPITHTEAAGQDGFEAFMVENVGGVPFDYTVTPDEIWMAPDPSVGTALPPGMADSLSLLFMTSMLTEGGYAGNLTVSIPGIRADRIPPVGVSLTVPEPGALAAASSALLALALVRPRPRGVRNA